MNDAAKREIASLARRAARDNGAPSRDAQELIERELSHFRMTCELATLEGAEDYFRTVYENCFYMVNR